MEEEKNDLPPSYFEATGRKKKDKQAQTSDEVEEGGGTVTLDLDSIQVTYQFTNPVAEQSSYEYDRQWSLPGMDSASSNGDRSERRRSYSRTPRSVSMPVYFVFVIKSHLCLVQC